MTSQFFAILAAAGTVTAGAAATAATRSSDALPSHAVLLAAEASGVENAGRCRVEVLRIAAAGTAQVTRRVLDSGQCVCIMTTGPQATNGSAEDLVNSLLSGRSCEGAPLAADLPAEAIQGGMNGGLLGGIIGLAALGGIAGGLGSKSPG